MRFRLRMPRQKATSHLRCQVEWSTMPTVESPKLVDSCWRYAFMACSAGQTASKLTVKIRLMHAQVRRGLLRLCA
jgi:hypothetical protein